MKDCDSGICYNSTVRSSSAVTIVIQKNGYAS